MKNYLNNEKMKTVYLTGLILITLLSSNLLAQETSKDNYSGKWSNNSSWVGGWTDGSPLLLGLPETNANITIQGYIEVGSSPAPAPGSGNILSFAANKDSYQFIVNDTLIVYGDVDFANKAMDLVLGPGAVFIIFGDLNMNNKIDIASSGTLVVSGNFGKSGSQGSFTGTGNVYAGSYSGDAVSTIDSDGDSSFTIDQLSDDGFTDIEDFVGNGGTTPLPVQLLSFIGNEVEGRINLKWSTASEKNNDYYTIERSSDGLEYEHIANVNGAGNSTTVLEYSYTDHSPLYGRTYYRLKQTDFDGTSETFKPIAVELTSLVEGSKLKLSNNPVNKGDVVTVITSAKGGELLTIAVHNMLGEVILTDQFDNSKYEFTLNNNIKSGMYFVTVSSINSKKITRLVVR